MNSLKSKLLLLTIIPFIIGIFTLSGINYHKTDATLQETLKEFEISIYKEKEALLKHQFEVATSLIKTVLEKEKDISKAKEEIINLLTGIRYLDDKSGYFFAYEKKEMIFILDFILQNQV